MGANCPACSVLVPSSWCLFCASAFCMLAYVAVGSNRQLRRGRTGFVPSVNKHPPASQHHMPCFKGAPPPPQALTDLSFCATHSQALTGFSTTKPTVCSIPYTHALMQAILGWQDSAPGVSPNASRVATPCEFKPDVAWDFQYLVSLLGVVP
jgi:hypothetical protein